MGRYVAKRLVLLVIIIFFVSIAAFFLVHLLPGNPSVTILGPNATAANAAASHQRMLILRGTCTCRMFAVGSAGVGISTLVFVAEAPFSTSSRFLETCPRGEGTAAVERESMGAGRSRRLPLYRQEPRCRTSFAITPCASPSRCVR